MPNKDIHVQQCTPCTRARARMRAHTYTEHIDIVIIMYFRTAGTCMYQVRYHYWM